jgi:ferric-dicitrate binding protein FerR (iron transport regulator)
MQQEEIDIEALYSGIVEKGRIPQIPPPQFADPSTTVPGLTAVTEQPALANKESEHPRRPTRKLIYFGATATTTAAAAALLIIAGIFLLRRSVPPPVAPHNMLAKTVITPASDKAILTLADGSHIVLDDAANGNLARQGNTQLVKMAGGQLAYHPAAGDPATTDPASQQAPMTYNEMTTPRGGFYQLVLPDGSKVWLDAASSIRFPTAFTGKDRLVELNGEAYFEIAPNAQQPFLINSNGLTVQVLGTEFNMMAYSDEDAVRTTLVSGSVRVIRGNDQLQIRPGQQAAWPRNGNELRLLVPDMAEVLAWKQGEFRFEGLKIPAIMRQIARWYDVDVEFRGPQPANEFNGVIPRKRSVGDLLAVLEQTDVVHFTLEGRKIIVESVAH